MTITGIYSTRFLEKGDPDDQRPPLYLSVFINVVDEYGNKTPRYTLKETNLLKAAKFQKGVKYSISFGDKGYPTEVS